jgi:hypothetical protein
VALAPLAASVRAHLRKVRQGRKRVLVVSDVRLPYSVSRTALIRATITPKRGGRVVATLKGHAPSGPNALALSARLRRGPHRLKKNRYIVRLTASAGGQSAIQSMELVVK